MEEKKMMTLLLLKLCWNWWQRYTRRAECLSLRGS